MSSEPVQPVATIPEAAEPRAQEAEVPFWLVVVLLVLMYWGMVYFDERGGWFEPQVYAPYSSLAELQMYQPPGGGPNLAQGRTVYENVCALCHGTDGAGKPNQAPPLAGSEWVTGSVQRLVRIPLSGVTGEIQVKGQSYNLPSMPAMGAALSDDDLAAALTYMRQSWGNKAPAISAEEIKAIRTEAGSRAQPWTAAELLAIP
jgi:mono/diheme cytochrome c family protein